MQLSPDEALEIKGALQTIQLYEKEEELKEKEKHGSYNLEKVLNFSSRLEKSLNSVKVLEKYLISLLGLEKSLKFRNLFVPYHFSEKLNDFAG